MRLATTSLAIALTLAVAVTSAAGAFVPPIVINEVDYDQPVGFDKAEFIELKNTSTTAVSLAGWTLQLINGTVGSPVPYLTVTLPPAAIIAPNGYYVVSFGSAYPWWTDYQFNLIDSSVQNGPADAITLRDPLGVVADAVGYAGDCGAPYTEGGGTLLDDDDVTANYGLSRYPDGADSNVNAADFSLRCITPGAPNTASVAGCGLPVSAARSTWGSLKLLYR